jgi:hypothetical protein
MGNYDSHAYEVEGKVAGRRPFLLRNDFSLHYEPSNWLRPAKNRSEKPRAVHVPTGATQSAGSDRSRAGEAAINVVPNFLSTIVGKSGTARPFRKIISIERPPVRWKSSRRAACAGPSPCVLLPRPRPGCLRTVREQRPTGSDAGLRHK